LGGVDYIKSLLDALEEVECPILAGMMYTYWPADYSKPVEKEAERERSIISIKELADYAADKGIEISLEVVNRFEQYIINDADEAIAYAKDVDKPNVSVHLDTFHMNIEEDNQGDPIRRTGNLLGHFHVGEGNRKVPGKGSIDWDSVGQALRDINYDKFVVMEPFVRAGGTMGANIKVWRDLSDNATNEQLDAELAKSLVFLKSKFEK
jgi:D-psicose/D-tagatose/L-ribulose 3-epimerase